jgi:hypothetical protein
LHTTVARNLCTTVEIPKQKLCDLIQCTLLALGSRFPQKDVDRPFYTVSWISNCFWDLRYFCCYIAFKKMASRRVYCYWVLDSFNSIFLCNDGTLFLLFVLHTYHAHTQKIVFTHADWNPCFYKNLLIVLTKIKLSGEALLTYFFTPVRITSVYVWKSLYSCYALFIGNGDNYLNEPWWVGWRKDSPDSVFFFFYLNVKVLAWSYLL